MTTPTDHELVAAANRGDPAAFEALYRRHRDWVVRLAERVTGSRDDALDVLQEAFAQLFARFPGFVLTAQLTSFLYPMVRHLALDRVRRRRPTVDIETLAEFLPAPPLRADAGDLERLVTALPVAQREVVLLRYVEDFSLAQIATVLGLAPGTVKSRLHAALQTLRTRVARDD